jgi:hypothetical protein
MMQQELLPFDKQEFADRCQAIERLTPAVTGLLPGQLKKVRDFLKRVFKHKWSAPNGTITFVRCAEHLPGANNLAIEFEVTGRTIDNWLRWAIQAGLIETSVSADRFGRRQTTLEFRWENIFALAELALQQRETEGTKAKRFPDQSETVSGPKRNGFATKAKRFPNQSETVSLSYNQVLPIPPPLTKEPRQAAADLGSSVGVLDRSETEAPPDPAWSDQAAEVEEILATRLHPITARRVARLCDAATARDIIVEYDHAVARGHLNGPGAIAARIETGQWPQDRVRTAAEIRAAKEATERHRAAERAAQATREHERELARTTAVELESRYGPVLDGMDPKVRKTFARKVLGEWMYGRWQRGELNMLVRENLLEALSKASSSEV